MTSRWILVAALLGAGCATPRSGLETETLLTLASASCEQRMAQGEDMEAQATIAAPAPAEEPPAEAEEPAATDQP